VGVQSESNLAVDVEAAALKYPHPVSDTERFEKIEPGPYNPASDFVYGVN
jgi:hypothetical protein